MLPSIFKFFKPHSPTPPLRSWRRIAHAAITLLQAVILLFAVFDVGVGLEADRWATLRNHLGLIRILQIHLPLLLSILGPILLALGAMKWIIRHSQEAQPKLSVPPKGPALSH